MPADFLHNHPEFQDLLRIVGQEQGINPALIEKDYWIMQCLFGLQAQGFNFELKGGTSLSKGFGIIDRFSEDLDIRIQPSEAMAVAAGRNQDKPKHVESRRGFYTWLSETIRIDGVETVSRDTGFDDSKLRSAGIRLNYRQSGEGIPGLKEGVLLEVGFDDVTPNFPRTISSWAWDFAVGRGVEILDNRAVDVACYHPGYTLVEKLQTISTKFRRQQESGDFPANFLRHYYDIHSLLGHDVVLEFVGSEAYFAHKKRRFRGEERDLTKNQAMLLEDGAVFDLYRKAYDQTESLYFRGRPSFDAIMDRIRIFTGKL